jgi:hypothetical protein
MRVRLLKPSDCCVGFGVDFVACRQGRVSEGRSQIGLATLADSTIHSIVPYLESRAGLTLVVTAPLPTLSSVRGFISFVGK